MPEDCDILDCCGPQNYGYDVAGGTPNVTPQGVFTLSVTVDPANSGTVTGAGTYPAEQFATLTATPAAGYAFTGWTGDLVSAEPTIQVYMDANKSLTANFVLTTYLLSITRSPDTGGTTTGEGNYSDGDIAVLTAIPAANFVFDGWAGDLVSTNNPENLLMNGDKEVTANFTQPEYTLSLSVNNAERGTTSGAGTYLSGTVVPVSAIAADGSCFKSWTGDIVSTSENETILMDGNKSATANFAPLGCCDGYAMVLVLDQTGSIGAGGAAAGINIIDNANIGALGVVSFGDTVCYQYPITTDLAAVRAFLEAAIATGPPAYDFSTTPPTLINTPSSFWCLDPDAGGDIPENGVDALAAALIMLSSSSTTLPKAIYFRTDTAGFIAPATPAATVDVQLNGAMMAFTWLEFGSETSGDPPTEAGFYATAFPETAKLSHSAFPDCSI